MELSVGCGPTGEPPNSGEGSIVAGEMVAATEDGATGSSGGTIGGNSYYYSEGL